MINVWELCCVWLGWGVVCVCVCVCWRVMLFVYVLNTVWVNKLR